MAAGSRRSKKSSNHLRNEMPCQVSCSLAVLCFSPQTEKIERKELLLFLSFFDPFHFFLSFVRCLSYAGKKISLSSSSYNSFLAILYIVILASYIITKHFLFRMKKYSRFERKILLFHLFKLLYYR